MAESTNTKGGRPPAKKKATTKRAAPKTAAKPVASPKRSARKSREQDSRETALGTMRGRKPITRERPSKLPAIPPRRGMVQRWVRVRVRNVDDLDNYMQKMNEGWRSRSVKSLPPEYPVISPETGNFAGMIMVAGNVLMERDIQLHREYQAAIRAETEGQMTSIKEQLFNEHTPGKGVGRPKIQSRSEVGVKRRMAPVMDDADDLDYEDDEETEVSDLDFDDED